MRYRTLNAINNIMNIMIYTGFLLMCILTLIGMEHSRMDAVNIHYTEYGIYSIIITLILMCESIWLEEIVINWNFTDSDDIIDELFRSKYHASHYSFVVLRDAVKWYIKARKISDEVVEKAYEEYMMGYGKEPAIEHSERVLRFMSHLKFKASDTANNY